MIGGVWFGRALLVLASAILLGGLTGLAASSTLPPTRGNDTSYAVTPDTLKPTECNGITLTALQASDAATITGAATNELLLGGPANQDIDGSGGDDCVLGGGGDDTLQGNAGTDVCLGGPGTDSFPFGHGCETATQ